ncbi:MAG: carbon storage regulator [Myxococcota bacterium]
MLTLTRRLGERIVIGAEVEIEVVQISGGRVRLGIRAPRSLPVYRGELVDKVGAQNLTARAEPRSAEPIELPADLPVLSFPEGLFGMPTLTRWVLYELADEIEGAPAEQDAQVRVLVSVDDGSIRLLVLDLCAYAPGYPANVACAAAGTSPADVAVAGVVTAPADGAMPTVNMAAPLVVDLNTRVGRQVILADDALNIAHPLAERIGFEEAAW